MNAKPYICWLTYLSKDSAGARAVAKDNPSFLGRWENLYVVRSVVPNQQQQQVLTTAVTLRAALNHCGWYLYSRK